jgi:hypothetical protein
MKTTLAELVILRNMIDSLLADRPNEAVEASLYVARILVTQAIREQAALEAEMTACLSRLRRAEATHE